MALLRRELLNKPLLLIVCVKILLEVTTIEVRVPNTIECGCKGKKWAMLALDLHSSYTGEMTLHNTRIANMLRC